MFLHIYEAVWFGSVFVFLSATCMKSLVTLGIHTLSLSTYVYFFLSFFSLSLYTSLSVSVSLCSFLCVLSFVSRSLSVEFVPCFCLYLCCTFLSRYFSLSLTHTDSCISLCVFGLSFSLNLCCIFLCLFLSVTFSFLSLGSLWIYLSLSLSLLHLSLLHISLGSVPPQFKI